MIVKPGLKDLLWLAAGAVFMFAIMLGVLYLHEQQSPAAQLAFKARKAELVERIRLALASASEAADNAVIAMTDQDSSHFADQSRAQVAVVERERQELEGLLQTGGTKTEQDLLGRFSRAFAEFQHIDKELLDLAVRNTNLKAYRLTFGPAAEVLKEMDAALSRLVVQSVNSSSPDAKQVMRCADDARIRALWILTLLPPHIAEESDRKMDELESQMAQEDQGVRQDFQSLAALLKPAGSPDLETAVSCYDRFDTIRAQIIRLSRENTNIRSVSISLNEKRRVMLVCQNALVALEDAIQREPIAKAPPSPR